jgi:glutaredoxin/glutathione-dependent peroxiredoxin
LFADANAGFRHQFRRQDRPVPVIAAKKETSVSTEAVERRASGLAAGAARRLRRAPGYAIGGAVAPPAALAPPGGAIHSEGRSMTIQVGDKIPATTLKVVTAEGPKDVASAEFFGGKKVVLFAVPGAFTPACSQRHMPGFVEKAADLKAKGIDTIACIAVNDQAVMGAWGKAQNVGDKITMLADGSGDFARALGLDIDLSRAGLGTRSKRYSMLVENGTVKSLNVEQVPSQVEVSSAEAMLKAL